MDNYIPPVGKAHREFTTVGELKRYIADLPDVMPVVRLTRGHHAINQVGVYGFVGMMEIARTERIELVLRLDT